MIQRTASTADAFAQAIADCLRTGKHGTPVIVERFGSLDGMRGGFVVTDAETRQETYRVTVERTDVWTMPHE